MFIFNMSLSVYQMVQCSVCSKPIPPGPWFNIKMSSYQYRKSHCGCKTILWPSYLHNDISYTGKTTSLYWIRDQVLLVTALWPTLQWSTVIARYMGPTLGPSGADRTQVGPMLAPWTLLSGTLLNSPNIPDKSQGIMISAPQWLSKSKLKSQEPNPNYSNQSKMHYPIISKRTQN